MPALRNLPTVVSVAVRTLAVMAGFLATAGPLAVSGADEAADAEFFEKSVRPLLVQHCYACHGKGQRKGGLSLESRTSLMTGGDSGPAVDLDKPHESLLVRAVEYDVEQMPPSGKLAAADIATFRKWVERGAPWPEKPGSGAVVIRQAGQIGEEDRAFWSFQQPRRHPLPAVTDPHWCQSAIDRFIRAKLDEVQLSPVSDADSWTLVRRLCMDLTGLPPTREMIDEFAADAQPDALQRLVERLLASPHHGERWARYWLDIARYGEDQAHTFQARMYPEGWRYRDWIARSFNRDLPYDQFVAQQIAGDLLPDENPLERFPALGFFALGPVYYADAGCAPKALADEWDDRVDTLSRGLLGLTVSCARCHDHKFDPITMRDYYALAGVFAGTKYEERPLAPAEVVQAYQDAQARVKEQEKSLNDRQTELSRQASERLVGQVAQYLVAAWTLQNRRVTKPDLKTAELARDESLHEFMLEAWIKFLTPENVDKQATLEPWKKALANLDARRDLSADDAARAAVLEAAKSVQDRLQTAVTRRDKSDEPLLKQFLTDGKAPLAIPKDKLEGLLDEAARQSLAEARQELERLKKSVPAKYPVAHALADAEPKTLKIHLRGDHKNLGDEAPRRFLEVLSSTSSPPLFSQGSGRLDLAREIASPENPLTARVIVNRVWQEHFGRGIVGTPSNFGLLGERPTHPELLDDLSRRFMDEGWSLKWLHRELALSHVYRLAARTATPHVDIDADNRLLWRANRRRLDIEAWRDSVLSASGALDLRVGGPPSDLRAADHRRRTLYSTVSRHDLNGMLRLFDFPDPNLTSERRVVTTVPLQQLFVLNGEFMIRQAQTLATRLEREAGTDPAARIQLAYETTLARPARPHEIELGLRFIADASADAKSGLSPWAQFAQALLATNELGYLD